MTKIDLRKELAACYPTGKKAQVPHLVTVPAGTFLMADGSGDPNTSDRFTEVTGALYAIAYGAKFAAKDQGLDYSVMPLEGLWWAEDLAAFSAGRRDKWQWTLMIRQPDQLERAVITAAMEAGVRKGKLAQSLAEEIRVERFDEGISAQILHVGPYEAEPPVIEALHEFVAAEGYELRGSHHEVYLGDPRRAAPDKLKTVLRNPVTRR